MKIDDYFNNINKTSQDIFQETIKNTKEFGKIHHTSSFLYEFSEFLFDVDERNLLKIVSTQLDFSAFNMSLGMYRQAFSSLRLAFEMTLGVVYFSINKLEHNEWLIGKNDIKWSKLIDEDSGILSKRFSTAFFPELSNDIVSSNGKAKELYRELSEYVHGNHETWNNNEVMLKRNDELITQYFNLFSKYSEITLLVLFCRYIKSINEYSIDGISIFFLEEMHEYSPIREYFGGVKDES